MTAGDPHLSSDQALESLLARTRADLTERALGEVDRVNADLDNLLYRVSGTRRGARAHALREGVASQASTRPLIAGADLDVLGVPAHMQGLRPSTIDELVEFIPDGVEPAAQPGGIVAVIGNLESVSETVQVAARLAERTPGPARVVFGGAKTLIPGEAPRVRTGDEAMQDAATHSAATTYLVLIDSPQATHARNAEKIAEAADPARVWAVVSAAERPEALDEWLWHLPGGLRATDLAVTHVWDADRPAGVLGLSTPVGMLDLAPALPELWRLILTRRLRRDGWRG